MRSKEHIEAQINEKLSEQVSGVVHVVHVVDKSWVEKPTRPAVQDQNTLSSFLHPSKASKCEHSGDLIKKYNGVLIG